MGCAQKVAGSSDYILITPQYYLAAYPFCPDCKRIDGSHHPVCIWYDAEKQINPLPAYVEIIGLVTHEQR